MDKRNIIFENNTGNKAHFFTCNFEESYSKFMLGIFPNLSNVKYDFELENNQKSEPFKFEKGYPYMVVIYTFDYKIYNLMYLCYIGNVERETLIKLSNKNYSSDLSQKLGYYYVNITYNTSIHTFTLPTLKTDITSFVNDSSGVQFGENENKFFINRDILSNIMSWSKINNLQKEMNIENNLEINKINSISNSTNSFSTNIYFIIFAIIFIIILILLFVFYFSK